PGATLLTDGHSSYPGLTDYRHDPRVVGKMAGHAVLPWIHRVFALMKRWGLGTYHGLRRKHVDTYLDEFVFRYNRRFYRHASFEKLLGLTARHAPSSYRDIVGRANPRKGEATARRAPRHRKTAVRHASRWHGRCGARLIALSQVRPYLVAARSSHGDFGPRFAQRLQDLEEQFSKVSGGLLLRLERPSDVGQRLLGDRAKDGSNAAFEMEMDRGRADPQRLGELAQAEPVRAGALDQLGGGGDDRTLRQAGAGSGLPFLLNNWTRGLLFGYFDDGHDDARDEQRKAGRPERIGRPAHYSNSATIYPSSPTRTTGARFARERERASLSQALPVRPLRGPVLRAL